MFSPVNSSVSLIPQSIVVDGMDMFYLSMNMAHSDATATETTNGNLVNPKNALVSSMNDLLSKPGASSKSNAGINLGKSPSAKGR